MDVIVRQRPKRRLWIGAGIGAGGCTAGLLLACLALVTVVGLFLAYYENAATTEWIEAAEMAGFPLYQPSYLPPNSGRPSIEMNRFGGIVEDITATYPGGLVVLETNREWSAGTCDLPILIEGNDESCFESATGALLIRKGETWISLSGVEQKDLVQVAETLRPVAGTQEGAAGGGTVAGE